MRLQTTITELTEAQWEFVQRTVKTGYEIPEDASRVCLVIEHGDFSNGGVERHAEMSLGSFIGVLVGLGMASVTAYLSAFLAEAALTPDSLPDTEAGQDPMPDTEAGQDPGPARNNCAFCHRERTAKDDNHADTCPYWSVGPGSLR